MAKNNTPSRTAAARQSRILAMLRESGEVRVRRLTEELGVTAMTVWRDVQVLEELGQVRRVHGAIRLPAGLEAEPDFEHKAARSAKAKERIAAYAAKQFINDGDIIALEGGTTVAALLPHLPELHVSIITNSIPIAALLRASRPALPVRMIGGWISLTSGNTTGSEALRTAAACRSSVCFLGASGWVRGTGPMDPNPLEVEVKRAMAVASGKVVLLLDSTKFDRRSVAVTIHPRRLTALITDAEPPDWMRRELEAAGVQWQVAL